MHSLLSRPIAFFLIALGFAWTVLPGASGTAADPAERSSEKITVKATDGEVRTNFAVKKGEWIELAITGKWRMWDRWDYTGPLGHVEFKNITSLGNLGALVCRIGDGKPFALTDLYPFQAADSGEIRLWPNREGRASLKADGQLSVVIRTGEHLKDKRAKELAARKETDDKLQGDPEIKQALALLNAARKACGLKEVKLSLELSRGCQKHAQYLVLNVGNPLIDGLKAHEEHKSLKGYSEEGAMAGKSGVIHFVRPTEAFGGWMESFYHRIPLLQPTLEEVGIGYFVDDKKRNWASVIDCMSGNVDQGTKDIVFYPDEGQMNVPLVFGGEVPSPLPAKHVGVAGFPITVYFAERQQVTKVAMALSDAAGAGVKAYLSTPEKPATGFPQWNSICLIPAQKLAAGKRYTVKLQCDVSGAPFTRTWSFTTAGKK